MFDVNMFLAALGGGGFAAAIGPLWSFIFTGFMVIAGVAAEFFGTPEAGGILNSIAFGPYFGPHVAFVGGVAGACYAMKKEYLETARDIGTPLIKYGDTGILVIGALFGGLGYGIFTVLDGVLAIPTDNIAFTVAIGNILARLVILGQGPLGQSPEGRGIGQRFAADETNLWVPTQASWDMVALLGIIAGLVSGSATLVTGSPFIGFGIAAASLIALQTVGAGPVTHHMTLPAGLAAAATGNLLLAAAWGLVGALLGEVFARLFISYGKSHIDPPACSITVTTFLIIMLLPPF